MTRCWARDGVTTSLFLSAVAGCAGLAGGERVVAAPATPAVVDLSGIPLRPGVHVQSVPVAGQPRTIRVVVPARRDLARNPAPLVIELHGFSGSKGMQAFRAVAVPAFDSLQPIIVAPESSNGEWWKPDEAAVVLGLVDAAKAQWPVDPRRVVVMGYSNGGIGAWFFARIHPEHFSAAIPIASNETIIGPTKLPIYALHGDEDEVFEVGGIRKSIASLQAAGFQVTLKVLPRCGHKDIAACDYGPEMTAAASWLERVAWAEREVPASQVETQAPSR